MQKVVILSGPNILTVDAIEHEGRAWIVPNWIVSPDKKWMKPLRIIAPRFAQGSKPIPGFEALQHIFGAMQLPESLLERGQIPPGLAQLIEVHENPDIIVRNPDVLN